MIKQLVQDQEAVARTARRLFPWLDKVSDEPTTDLLMQRMQIHGKGRLADAWGTGGGVSDVICAFPCRLPFLREFLLVM